MSANSSDYDTVPKIYRHKKGDTISITNSLAGGVKLKVSCSEAGWRRLIDYSEKHKNRFRDDFYYLLLVPVDGTAWQV